MLFNCFQPESQFELTIFSENLYKYRYLLKEGNLLIFNIDILKKMKIFDS